MVNLMIAEKNPSSDLSPDGCVKLALDPHDYLAAVVESSDDPIIGETLDGTIIGWNTAAGRIFGYQPDEIIGRSIRMLIPPELHDEEDDLLRRLRDGVRIEHFETIRMTKNGERLPISVTIAPIRDGTGKIIAASSIARDISVRKKTDESQFLLAAIVDSADDAIVSKDLNGIITSWNEGARKMFGYTSPEMVGQSILRLIPEELKGEEDEILRKLRAGQRIEHYETTRRRKDGSPIEVSVTISPVRNEAGVVIGASKIARDISERKQLQRLVLQSEKLAATGRMAAAIAHEINNPLEALINVIFLARQYSSKDARVRELLETAEGELERVAHIARQTLGYYRDTGAPTAIHLHELLENVLAVYNSKMMSIGIAVTTNFNDMQKIVVSRGELLQVFSNVIANSIDAMGRGGVLNISTQKVLGSRTDGIQIVIRDNGVGIEQNHIARVFEPFFTTKGDLGTGIGLWVARQLIERRGGQISVASSTGPGDSGTTIKIFIPFALPPEPFEVSQSDALGIKPQ
jgi:PAS domain S-box-containing protein